MCRLAFSPENLKLSGAEVGAHLPLKALHTHTASFPGLPHMITSLTCAEGGGGGRSENEAASHPVACLTKPMLVFS